MSEKGGFTKALGLLDVDLSTQGTVLNIRLENHLTKTNEPTKERIRLAAACLRTGAWVAVKSIPAAGYSTFAP